MKLATCLKQSERGLNLANAEANRVSQVFLELVSDQLNVMECCVTISPLEYIASIQKYKLPLTRSVHIIPVKTDFSFTCGPGELQAIHYTIMEKCSHRIRIPQTILAIFSAISHQEIRIQLKRTDTTLNPVQKPGIYVLIL